MPLMGTESTHRTSARSKANIYSQNLAQMSVSSGKRRFNSKNSSRQRDSSKRSNSATRPKKQAARRKKVQPGQGILLNNFFPALESGDSPLQGDKLAQIHEQALLAAQQ